MFRHTLKSVCKKSFCMSKKKHLHFASYSPHNFVKHTRSFSSCPVLGLSKSNIYCADESPSEKGLPLSQLSLNELSPDTSEQDYLQYTHLNDVASSDEKKTSGNATDTESEWSSENQLSLVKSEYLMMQQEGVVEVPSQLTDEQWQHLAALPFVTVRVKYLRHLFLIEKKIENEIKRKAKRKEISETRYYEVQEELKKDGHIVYGLWTNAIHMKIHPTGMSHVNNHKLIQAKLLGQPIVLDFDYDGDMTERDMSSLGDQLMMCLANNRQHPDPFDMRFLNYDPNCTSGQFLQKRNPQLGREDCLIDTHSSGLLEHFSPEQLVIITPFAQQPLSHVSPDVVHVIPAVVQRGAVRPVALARAKRLGVAARSLPVSRYISVKSGRAIHLPVNQILNILLDMRLHGNWTKAFLDHLPRYSHNGAAADAVPRLLGGSRRRSGESRSALSIREVFGEESDATPPRWNQQPYDDAASTRRRSYDYDDAASTRRRSYDYDDAASTRRRSYDYPSNRQWIDRRHDDPLPNRRWNNRDSDADSASRQWTARGHEDDVSNRHQGRKKSLAALFDDEN